MRSPWGTNDSAPWVAGAFHHPASTMPSSAVGLDSLTWSLGPVDVSAVTVLGDNDPGPAGTVWLALAPLWPLLN